MKETVRIARICPFEKNGSRCMWRTFGDPEAVCPEHKRGADQPNRPYNPKSKVVRDG